VAFGVDLIPKYEAARTPSRDGESAENPISNMVYLKDIPILRTTKRMNRGWGRPVYCPADTEEPVLGILCWRQSRVSFA
jgi:hypothetical protein